MDAFQTPGDFISMLQIKVRKWDGHFGRDEEDSLKAYVNALEQGKWASYLTIKSYSTKAHKQKGRVWAQKRFKKDGTPYLHVKWRYGR